MKAPKKYVLGLLGIFFLVLLVFFFAPKARSWYGAWKDARFQAKVQGVRKEIYDAAMADTYGGKTPQETLRMYIEAVEKGDYELASKYFVEEKREEWQDELGKIRTANKIDIFITPLKNALTSKGGYSSDKQQFFISDPVGVDFVLYPNGIWKLTDI